MKLLIRIVGILFSFFALIFAAIYLTTYHPDKIENIQPSCKSEPKLPAKGQKLKILSWNVQYFASKNYIFFYDMPDFKGKDIFPSKEDVDKTFVEVARIINEESPDIIHLQEVNIGAKSTYYENQVEKLLSLLKDNYNCNTTAYYHKAAYMPKYYFGPVGMNLLTISKYKISKSERYALPEVPADPISRNFGFKRAVLISEIPFEGGNLFTLNTHLDAFSQGSDTMEQQVKVVESILDSLTPKGPWIISGDFNLLPPGFDKNKLHPDHREYYNDKSEMEELFQKYQSSVSADELNGKDQEKFYTHIPNHPESKFPDRTIDYFLYSNIKKINYYVRQKDTLKISDHLPMIFEFEL